MRRLILSFMELCTTIKHNNLYLKILLYWSDKWLLCKHDELFGISEYLVCH